MLRQLQVEFLLDQLLTRAHSPRTQALYNETFHRFTLTLANFERGDYLQIVKRQLSAVASYHTARGHLSRIQTFARWLAANQHIGEVRPLKLRYLKPTEAQLPTALELTTLLTAMLDRHTAAPAGRARTTRNDLLITQILITTGVRIAEALNLQPRDLQHDDSAHWLHIRGGKTPSASRSIVITSTLFLDLTNHATDHERSPLFQSRRLRPLSTRDFANWLREFARSCGIETHITPHVLRYNFIMHQAASGKSLFEVMTMAGHASPRQTIYYFNRVRRLMPTARVSPDLGFIEKGD